MTKKLPYRPNVGIMVLNADNKVWVGRRAETVNTEYEHSTALWQMPQGGVDKGEDPEKASLRELYEETGITSVTLLQATDEWIKYDFPEGITRKIADKYSGQKQKWFAYRFDGDESEIQINPPPDGNEAEFDEWKWVDMEELPDLIVAFKRDVYVQVVAAFRVWLGRLNPRFINPAFMAGFSDARASRLKPAPTIAPRLRTCWHFLDFSKVRVALVHAQFEFDVRLEIPVMKTGMTC